MNGFNWTEDAFSNVLPEGSFGLQNLHKVLQRNKRRTDEEEDDKIECFPTILYINKGSPHRVRGACHLQLDTLGTKEKKHNMRMRRKKAGLTLTTSQLLSQQAHNTQDCIETYQFIHYKNKTMGIWEQWEFNCWCVSCPSALYDTTVSS